MKTILRLFFSFALLALQSNVFSQAQAFGTFPAMDGGLEGQTTTGSQSSTSIATGTQLTTYTGANLTNSTPSINTTTVRTGSKSLQWTTSSTSGVLFSPTAPSTGIANNTSYVVQFYWWKGFSGSARSMNIAIGSDGTTNIGSNVSSGTLGTSAVSVGWTLATTVVTSGSSSASPRYGLVQIKPNGGSFSTAPGYLFDDIVVYPGSAADVAAPDVPTAANITSPTTNSLNVNWTAPATGVDGGGYIVVRGTADPTTPPNANGIYGVGNSIGSGTVVYAGTGTSFTDNGLTSGTTYFYRVYTADKAFNYSATAAATSGSTGTFPVTITNFFAEKKANNIQLSWNTVTETNMNRFEIEYSTNGREFLSIGSVQAKNLGAVPSSYSWLHTTPVNGDNFYRLRSIEKDGSFKLSSVVKINLAKTKQELSIAPNPVKAGKVNLQLSNVEKGAYQLALFTANGQQVYSGKLEHDGGSSTYSLQLPFLKPGTYNMQVTGSAVKLTRQVIIE